MIPDLASIKLELLVPLVAGHILGDFVFQTDAMVANKGKFWPKIQHVAIVTAVSFGLTGYPSTFYWLIPALFVAHFLIDSAKARLTRVCTGGNGPAALFLGDQAAHGFVLLALAWSATACPDLRETVWGAGGWVHLFGPRYLKALVLIGGFVLAGQGSGYLLKMILARFENELSEDQKAGLTKGGYWIGLTERALIFIFVLANAPAGIGLLAAAKSVFSIGAIKDAKDRKLAEYTLIGTLMSFSLAMIIGYATREVLTWIT